MQYIAGNMEVSQQTNFLVHVPITRQPKQMPGCKIPVLPSENSGFSIHTSGDHSGDSCSGASHLRRSVGEGLHLHGQGSGLDAAHAEAGAQVHHRNADTAFTCAFASKHIASQMDCMPVVRRKVVL